MGLIKAATSSVGGGLADQWLEVIEPDNMGDTTVMTKGVFVRKDDKRGRCFNRWFCCTCLSQHDDASCRWGQNHRLHC